MRPLRAWLSRLSGGLTRTTDDRDFAEELDADLQAHIDDNIRAGMTQDDARRHALCALGGVAQTKENYRRAGSISWIDDLGDDLRYASRTLRRSRGFTVTAIAVIA